MDLYELLVFAHVSAVIAWVGGGVLFHILAFRFDRAGDEVALEKVFESTAALGTTFFMPVSLLALITGVLATIDGPWGFGMLWIVLGLVGFTATFLTGMLWIEPQSRRVKELMQRDGGMSADAGSVAKRMIVVARIDYVVLFLVVFDMVVKPTGEDTGVLVFMAAALIAAAALLIWRARSIATPAPAA